MCLTQSISKRRRLAGLPSLRRLRLVFSSTASSRPSPNLQPCNTITLYLAYATGHLVSVRSLATRCSVRLATSRCYVSPLRPTSRHRECEFASRHLLDPERRRHRPRYDCPSLPRPRPTWKTPAASWDIWLLLWALGCRWSAVERPDPPRFFDGTIRCCSAQPIANVHAL